MKKNDIIKFGKYDWRVLKVKKNKALIISEHVLEHKAFNESVKTNKWKKCSLKTYLNGEFLEQFSQDERACITDKGVFLLSIKQVQKHFGSYAERLARCLDDKPSLWWLRSPSQNPYSVAIIIADGGLYLNGPDVDCTKGGVRPALWLKLEPNKEG